MSDLSELERHIQSIQQTRQITNAMYLTSSSKMRKAMKMYDDNRSYMKGIYPVLKFFMENEICEDSQYFKLADQRKYAYIVVTSDQGLAGAYNTEIISLATQMMEEKKPTLLFPIGNVGEEYFRLKGYDTNSELKEHLKVISTRGARFAAQTLFDLLQENEITEIYIAYTKMESPFHHKPVIRRLMPVVSDDYPDQTPVLSMTEGELVPSAEEVLTSTMEIYLMGRIYHALVQSYAAEHSIRMQAMEAATRNADEMLMALKKKANQARQEKITQEITEIASGSMAIGGDS